MAGVSPFSGLSSRDVLRILDTCGVASFADRLPDTGLLAGAGQRNAVVEYFKTENAPERQSTGSAEPGQPDHYDQINDIF